MSTKKSIWPTAMPLSSRIVSPLQLARGSPNAALTQETKNQTINQTFKDKKSE